MCNRRAVLPRGSFGVFGLRPGTGVGPTCSPASPCDDAAMETDSYWRTRAISEAQAPGYSHLRAVCSGCGRITDIPWLLLLRRPGAGKPLSETCHSAEKPCCRSGCRKLSGFEDHALF